MCTGAFTEEKRFFVHETGRIHMYSLQVMHREVKHSQKVDKAKLLLRLLVWGVVLTQPHRGDVLQASWPLDSHVKPPSSFKTSLLN